MMTRDRGEEELEAGVILGPDGKPARPPAPADQAVEVPIICPRCFAGPEMQLETGGYGGRREIWCRACGCQLSPSGA